jgi:hypothetical protein
MTDDAQLRAPTDPREDVILRLGRNKRLAHASLFGHRHPNVTPDLHYEIIDLWHSPSPKVLLMAFRGAGKSTLSEEAVIVEACLRQFKNGVIIGSSYERAVERLTSIKHEFETNPFIEELFGDLCGPTWNEGKIILANGVVIQAFGRGQSMRGAKHHDQRPDRAFADDLEEQEDVETPEARLKTLRWFMKVVIPALTPEARIRVAATPLDKEALSMQLAKDPGWVAATFPIETIDVSGDRKASWPDRYPLEWIDKTRSDFERLGMATEYKQEFMCEAEDPASKTFTADLFRVEPIVRTWQATFAFLDPARTVKATSSSTGWAVWSWVNNRLIVWDGGGGLWKPDEIVNQIFVIDEQYSPVEIGVERDGLEEFLLQPLRQEMSRRNTVVPIRAMKAPTGKMSFIKGLQQFFRAREVVFAKHLPELQAQLLSFPSGRIDAPNALAYALKMRPGSPVYEDFNVVNIFEDLALVARTPAWLALNATAAWTTGVLVQSVEGALHVVADWVFEGGPGQVLASIVANAGLETGRTPLRVIAGPVHFTGHDTVGLRASAAKVPIGLRTGVDCATGQAELRELLKRTLRGQPVLRVSSNARWTLNAFSGGYCRDVLRSGELSDFTKTGPHKVLMEGLEAFAGLLRAGVASEDDSPANYAYAADGRRYLSAFAGKR